jgi:hypothetical protein
METEANKESRELLRRLVKIVPDNGIRKWAEKALIRLKAPPMEKIVAELPPAGGSIIQKAERLGVTRQAIYAWLYGHSRPTIAQARKIARITGYDADAIRGRPADGNAEPH